jgi:hypothetical protein
MGLALADEVKAAHVTGHEHHVGSDTDRLAAIGDDQTTESKRGGRSRSR